MLPSSTKQPPPADHRALLQSIKSRISPHHFLWLAATIFLQLLIIALLNRASDPTPLPSTHLLNFQSHDDPTTTTTPTPPTKPPTDVIPVTERQEEDDVVTATTIHQEDDTPDTSTTGHDEDDVTATTDHPEDDVVTATTIHQEDDTPDTSTKGHDEDDVTATTDHPEDDVTNSNTPGTSEQQDNEITATNTPDTKNHDEDDVTTTDTPVTSTKKLDDGDITATTTDHPKDDVTTTNTLVTEHQDDNGPAANTPVENNRDEADVTTTATINTEGHEDADDTCPNGRVYVYELPPLLNKDLLANCHDLDPWASRCNAVSNDGFGPPATGLTQIIPANLTSSWYWTDMYSAEVIYHHRMLNHRCRTTNQDAAAAFYIPFYVGLAVGKYLWYNYTSHDRDFHSIEMLKWVSGQPGWRRSNGSDHFIMLGRLTWDFRRQTESDKEWGTSFVYMPLMKNVFRLTVEKNQWDQLEVSVPYPTAFHPRSGSEIRQWQDLIRNRKRSSFFSFVGATRKKIKNDFRGLLMSYAKKQAKSNPVRVVDCSIERCYDGAPAILEAFLDSDFCLQPKGDGYTRRSAYDCMLAGSIPVYFWRGSFEYQFEWHLPKAAETYSVFIDHNVVRNGTSVITKVLEKFSKEEVKKMRETIIDFMPRFLYSTSDADLGGVWDAFDITMDQVLRRFKEQKMVAKQDH